MLLGARVSPNDIDVDVDVETFPVAQALSRSALDRSASAARAFTEGGPRRVPLAAGIATGDTTSAGPQHVAPCVAPSERRGRVARRHPIHLEDAIDQVDDPVVREAGSRIEAALAFPVDLEARLRHLDGEDSARGMGRAIVVHVARYHGHIRFGLGIVVEPDRPLGPHHPTRPEHGAERPRGLRDRRVVGGALRLRDDQLAREQLDRLAGPEDAEVNEALVLEPREATGLHLVGGHRRHRSDRQRRRQCRERDAPAVACATPRALGQEVAGAAAGRGRPRIRPVFR